MQEHVVIIEDDPYFLEVATYLLEEAGYKVTGLKELYTMEELIEADADCFLIDERLPYVNGHIICIMLKSRSETKHIPVVLMSAYEGLEGFAGLYKADGFIEKTDIDPRTLAELIGFTIENSKVMINKH